MPLERVSAQGPSVLVADVTESSFPVAWVDIKKDQVWVMHFNATEPVQEA